MHFASELTKSTQKILEKIFKLQSWMHPDLFKVIPSFHYNVNGHLYKVFYLWDMMWSFGDWNIGFMQSGIYSLAGPRPNSSVGSVNYQLKTNVVLDLLYSSPILQALYLLYSGPILQALYLLYSGPILQAPYLLLQGTLWLWIYHIMKYLVFIQNKAIIWHAAQQISYCWPQVNDLLNLLVNLALGLQCSIKYCSTWNIGVKRFGNTLPCFSNTFGSRFKKMLFQFRTCDSQYHNLLKSFIHNWGSYGTPGSVLFIEGWDHIK